MTQTKTANPLKEVLKYGQSIWYDGLISREEFKKLIEEDGIRGATTNPTIFEKAISSGVYDSQILPLKAHPDEDVFKAIAVKAVQEVADLFLPVFNESKGQDGFVSMEVSPLLAYESAGTIREAKELYQRVNRKNLMIKVPATKEGIPAIEALIAEGLSINITLIFSIERYQEVMNAYLAGLEKRATQGHPVSSIASVSSFFVSRVDTAVDKILEERISAEKDSALVLKGLLGKAAIANSKLAYEAFEKVFSSERFKKLKQKGANLQRPLWASTGTKNPNYSDVFYVETLIGPQTVDTIPPATLAAFREHGVAAPRLKEGLEESRVALRQLKELGIDLDAVTQKLEQDGVKLFSDSYTKLLECIESRKS